MEKGNSEGAVQLKDDGMVSDPGTAATVCVCGGLILGIQALEV